MRFLPLKLLLQCEKSHHQITPFLGKDSTSLAMIWRWLKDVAFKETCNSQDHIIILLRLSVGNNADRFQGENGECPCQEVVGYSFWHLSTHLSQSSHLMGCESFNIYVSNPQVCASPLPGVQLKIARSALLKCGGLKFPTVPWTVWP